MKISTIALASYLALCSTLALAQATGGTGGETNTTAVPGVGASGVGSPQGTAGTSGSNTDAGTAGSETSTGNTGGNAAMGGNNGNSTGGSNASVNPANKGGNGGGR